MRSRRMRLRRLALKEANRRYEAEIWAYIHHLRQRQKREEILTALETRMKNDDATELREAAEQQRQITALRLKRWLEGS